MTGSAKNHVFIPSDSGHQQLNGNMAITCIHASLHISGLFQEVTGVFL